MVSNMDNEDGTVSVLEKFVQAVEEATGQPAEPAEGNDKKFHLTCPAHDDDHQSLVAWDGEDGEQHVHCWSHICTAADVFEAIGWTVNRNAQDSVAA